MGKLNILHHKSWHVYKRDNRLRVQKDEENARIQEEEKLQKKLKDERDSRLTRLRETGGEQETFTLFPQTAPEQKKKDTKEEIKNDPWIMKLGETRNGERAEPWYSKVNVKEFTSSDQFVQKNLPVSYSSKMTREKDEIIKFKQDPLRIIKSVDSEDPRKEKSLSDKKNTIEELRRKRMEREKKESLKSMELLTGKKNLGESSKDYKLHERQEDYYHSQFNREALESVRANKKRR